jgi:predicted transcriptional regulator
MSVSLRLSSAVKRRVGRLARAQGTSAHAFMVAAIEERLANDEARGALLDESERRLAAMKRTGLAVPAAEVFDYLERRVAGKAARRPRARRH